MLRSQTHRSVAIVETRSGLPRALDTIVGGMLELAIHSIEGLRSRFGRLALLRRAAQPTPTSFPTTSFPTM